MTWYSFYDDVNDGWLETDKVNDARKLSWSGCKIMLPSTKSPSACSALVQRLLWIDTNWGDDVKENYRSRVVDVGKLDDDGWKQT